MNEGIAALIKLFQQASPELQKLGKTFLVWLSSSLLPERLPGVKLPKLRNLLEVMDMIAENAKGWTTEWLEQGRDEGRSEGA